MTTTISPANPRDAEVAEYGPLVHRMVRQLSERVPATVDRDALVSAGMLGLLDALDKYDGGRNVAFEAYARIRIRGAILDELRGLDHLTRSQRRRSRAVAESRTELEKQGKASDHEVADALGLSIEQVQESRRSHVPPDVVDPTQLDAWQLDGLWAAEDDAETRLSHRQQVQAVSRALAALPERNRLVVGLYYESDITLQEIGDLLGVTQSRVSQILKQTLQMLRDTVHTPGD